MKKAIILLSLALFIGFANAQDGNLKHPCFKVSSFSSSLGFSGAMTSNTDADYYSLQNAAEDPDLFVDISELKNGGNNWNSNGMYFNSYGSYGYNSGGNGNGSVLFNLGLTPYSKKLNKYRDNRELRISVGSNFGSRNSFNYYDNNTFVIDTFQSVNGSGVIYADSSINSNYYYSLDFTEINFGLSYLFKTDVNRRGHFYAGIGVNYGIAIKSDVSFEENIYRTAYYYNEFNKPSEEETYFYGNINNNGYSDSYSTTKLKSPMQFVRAYIPIGFSLRLSNKTSSFFNHVNLYTELNPGVELQILSPDNKYVNPAMGAAIIGFNYHW